MANRKKLLLAIGYLLLAILFLPSFVLSDNNSEEKCRLLVEQGSQNLSPTEYRQALEECAQYYQRESARIETDISKTEQEKKTLQNTIYTLNQKIKNLNYQISQSNLIIKDLGLQIEDTQASIEKTSLKIEDSKDKLANILRNINEEDQKAVVEILLAENDLSDFFDNIMALEILNSKSKEFLQDIKTLKANLEGQKQSLDEEKNGLEETVKIQTIQKEESNETKQDQEYYLQLTEQEYQKQLKEKEETQKKAAEIRTKIYELIGVRKAVTYEEALEVAKYAASLIGIRPALLLGILSQESSIGRNVGQCYLKDTATGAGVVVLSGKSVSRVMNPSRDVPLFLQIVDNLNKEKGLAMNLLETLVSCPMSFGWGGAMGPAQFIPSTWNLYQDKIKEKIGASADPWDLRDASVAASIYLKDKIDSYGSEGKAVQAYFCGRATNTYWCTWYEKNVLYLATCHQQFIDSGVMSDKCQKAIGLE